MTPYDYALIAREAYCAPPDIGVEDSASRAIIRPCSEGVCVAFPGTNNIASWVVDAEVLTTHVVDMGGVHRGFWEAWSAIAADVEKEIGDRPAILVGHSLGAAIAIIAAAQLTLAGKPPKAVYGFEPPRVSSDTTICKILSSVDVKLYKNGNDMVPDLPWGFHHAAALNKIGKAFLPIPNIHDHLITSVIESLS